MTDRSATTQSHPENACKYALWITLCLLVGLAAGVAGCSREKPSRPIRGDVLEVQRSRRVIIEMDSLDGIRPGTVMQVFRGSTDTSEPQYLGFVTVTHVAPAANLTGNKLRATGDNDCKPIKVNDWVSGSVPME